MQELIVTTIVLGAAAYFSAEAIRNFLGSVGALAPLLQRKPFGCDLCMSFWNALGWGALILPLNEEHGWQSSALSSAEFYATVFAGATVAYLLFLLRSSSIPPPGPFSEGD